MGWSSAKVYNFGYVDLFTLKICVIWCVLNMWIQQLYLLENSSVEFLSGAEYSKLTSVWALSTFLWGLNFWLVPGVKFSRNVITHPPLLVKEEKVIKVSQTSGKMSEVSQTLEAMYCLLTLIPPHTRSNDPAFKFLPGQFCSKKRYVWCLLVVSHFGCFLWQRHIQVRSVLAEVKERFQSHSMKSYRSQF